MKVIIIIIMLLAVIGLLWVILTALFTKQRIVKEFKHCNVIVFGKKGNGKDLLFQKVINSRKDPYYANISYGGKCKIANVKDLELTPNTCDNFINGKTYILKKNNAFENTDFYFSDLGVILPSQYDSKLHKNYPSFPIEYALSRHLYNNNIHFNTQALGRGWKALREQADYFIKCRGVIKLPFILVIKTTEYDKYESAEKSLLPMKNGLFNKYQKAEMEQYKATNGLIKNGFIVIRKKAIKYDTRAYHKILFGRKAPTRKKHTLKSLFLKAK